MHSSPNDLPGESPRAIIPFLDVYKRDLTHDSLGIRVLIKMGSFPLDPIIVSMLCDCVPLDFIALVLREHYRESWATRR
jgi:hypothetical protein